MGARLRVKSALLCCAHIVLVCITMRMSRGFSLMSVIIALVIAGFGMAAIGSLVVVAHSYYARSQDEARGDAHEAYAREAALKGIDAGKLYDPFTGRAATLPDATIVSDAGRSIAGGSEIRGLAATTTVVTQGTGVSGELVETEVTKGSGIGYESTTQADPVVYVSGKLLAPTAKYTLAVPASEFPLASFFVPAPGNPAGTVYRWAAGADPDESSPVWTDSSYLSLDSFPAELRVRATNDDIRCEPSDVLTVKLRASPTVAYERTDGSHNVDFFFTDATSASGSIVLISDLNVASVKIVYTLDGSDPLGGSGVSYSGPFNVPLNKWTEAGVLLRFAADSSDARYADSSIEQVWLSPMGVTLPKPSFNVASGSQLNVGAAVSASQGSAYGRIAVSKGRATTSSDAATITLTQ